jgi:antitoxin (DNA-binding transcriptional repressor) of toxin-antitoxin stability system
MHASIVDLRYKMKDVLKALKRNQKVTILNRGKIQGYIIPARNGNNEKVEEHPFFGMKMKDSGSVEVVMKKLRNGRYNAI